METTTHTPVPVPSDTTTDGDEGASYRTLSILAIISLVLGLAAPLCMAAPLLVVIPLCGAALSVAAILRIESSDGAMVGRKAALVGLGLSVASICAAYTRTTLLEQLLSWQARDAGAHWVQLLKAGEVDKAFELTLEYAKGQIPKPPANPGGPPPEPAPDPLEQFRANPVIEYLSKLGPDTSVQYQRDLAFAPGARDEYTIQQQYRISGGGIDGDAALPLRLTMLRVRANRIADARWLVERYERDAAAPPVPSGG